MSRKRLMSLKLFVIIAAVAALVPIAGAGWKDLYHDFLERGAPQIVISEFPRGIGLAPVTIKLTLSDADSGLDEVVVRIAQRGVIKELLRKSLGGAATFPISIDFPGDKSDLEEGTAYLEIKAFDRSFWSNSAETSLPLLVDFRKPKIEVLTSQHNATFGGSQVIFYKAFDEALAISGVKVGNQTYMGYPARGIDPAFEDPNVYVAIYASDLEQNVDQLSVRAFAEDQVGNASSATFYNRIADRNFRDVVQKLSEDFLRDQVATLMESNIGQLRELAQKTGKQIEFETRKGGADRLIEQFKYVNEDLRQLNQTQLDFLLKGPRFERYWDGPFLQQPGTLTGAFGDRINFTYETVSVGNTTRKGYEFTLAKDHSEVFAVSNGIVLFSENIGTYGRCVGIDHGLGLVSVYGYLDAIEVAKGDSVQSGQRIGVAGQTGMSNGNKLYFEVRVHGTPVDAREWWDAKWFYAHVTAKINEVKRSLGIPVYKPL